MRENKNNSILEKELITKLNWYTLHASEEEFDEKAVESILYLLDHVIPLGEDSTLAADVAWDRFQEIVDKRQELLPLKQDKLPRNPYDPDDKNQDKKPGKFRKCVQNHKILAAAALLLLIMAVSGTIQAGANAIQNNGFFFWMKRDDTGVQMMTSPENLDNTTNKKEYVYYDRADLPEWTQDWLQIENEFEMPDNYEWQYLETSDYEIRKQIISHYFNKNSNKEILLGAWIYSGTSYYSENFADYSYVQSYEISQKQIDIYNRIDETGEIFYIICFYEGNCKYFIRGQDNLNELELLIERYLVCVQENCKK